MGLCYRRAVSQRFREGLAVGLAVVAIAAGVASLFFGRVDPGIEIGRRDDKLVVTFVRPGSQGQRDGVLPGMVVVSVNGVSVLDLPHTVYPDNGGQVDADGNPIEPQPIITPTQPTPIAISDEALDTLLQGGVRDLQTIEPWDLERGSVDNWPSSGFYYSNVELESSAFPFAIGVLILLVGAWWLRTGLGGPQLQGLAVPLATAVAAPFLVSPIDSASIPSSRTIASLLIIVAMWPLADGLCHLIESESDRRFVARIVGVATLVAVVATLATTGSDNALGAGGIRVVLIGWIPLMAGIAAAGPAALSRLQSGQQSSGRLLESTELAVAGATPLFSLATGRDTFLFPLSLWLIVVALAGRFTIRPLARLATRAQLQRDLIVAATEAERARVAADIHDDALQELTLLVRRLDAAGDTEGADIARTISDRLRAICGDLRLPILDDLGVGPALDWLVLRIERLAGGEVRLERSDGTRPPSDVELAFFRVAQEALSNAVKHGQPPIVVRYRATQAGASLSIDDAGPGIPADAGSQAEAAGHFGLLNMEQRAQQIGAILDVRRWPTGGTHVALEWRPR
jgi:signal transduction histidine kinase